MAQVLVTDTYLSNACNAIRQKNGSTNTYTPSEMAAAILAIPTGGGSATLQDKTYTPSETGATITYDNGYDGLRKVTVAGITPTYIGSGIPVNPTITTAGNTVTVPTGYYSSQQTKTITERVLPTPTITLNPMTGVVTSEVTLSTAGYINTNSSTSTLQLTTHNGTTVIPSEVTTTIGLSGKYMVGDVTVQGITPTYIGSQISFITYYTGTATPASSLGINGDIYLMADLS